MPVERVGVKLMGKQFRNVSDLVSLIPMDRRIYLYKNPEKMLFVGLVKTAEPLSLQPVEFCVGSLLHTAIAYHIAQFALVALTNIHFQ
jgi:hypothetical protein